MDKKTDKCLKYAYGVTLLSVPALDHLRSEETSWWSHFVAF